MNAKIAILHVIDLFNIYIKISSRNVKLYIISGNLSKICKNCCRTACSGSTGEAFPLIATIGFLVDPMATCLNASGDAVASMMITRVVEGKDWINKKING